MTLALLLAAPGAMAETVITGPSSEATPAEVPDYAPGFRQLRELGLPGTRGARYVRLQLDQADLGPLTDEQELTGNAWLLEEKDGTGRFLTLLGKEIEVTSQDVTLNPAEATRLTGKWKDADWKADTGAMLAHLRNQDPDRSRYYSHYEGDLGALLLFATALHGAGHTKEANELAYETFRVGGTPQGPVERAMSYLMLQEYEELLAQLERDGDWNRLFAGIRQLAQRYDHHKMLRGQMLSYMEAIANRANAGTPPPLTGQHLDGQARQLAMALAATNLEKLGTMPEGNWLLGDATQTTEGGDGWISQVTARGVEAIPLLVALLPDEYPLPLRERTLATKSLSQRYGHRPDPEHSDHFYALLENRDPNTLPGMMSHPLTRGELAGLLLASLVGEEGGILHRSLYPHASGQHNSPAGRVARYQAPAMDLYEKLRGKGKKEIALYQLEHGSGNAQLVAMQHLLKGGSEEDFERVEAVILKPDTQPQMMLRMAQQYAAMRGPGAADFVEQLEPKLREAYQVMMGNQEPDYVQQVVGQSMDQLRSLTKEASLDDYVAGIQEADDNPRNVAYITPQLMQKYSPEEVTGRLLEEAAKEEDPQKAMMYLQALSGAINPYHQQGASGETGSQWADFKLNPKDQKEVWLKLLERDQYGEDGQTNLGLNAAHWIRSLASEEEPVSIPEGTFSLYGRRGNAVYIQRVRDYLNGKPEAEWASFPDPDAVPEAERTALARKLATLDGKAMAGWLEQASLQEIATLGKVLETPTTGEDGTPTPAMKAYLTGRNRTVATESKEKHLQKPDAFVGRQLDAKVVEDAISYVRNELKPGRVVTVQIIREYGLAGATRVKVLNAPADETNSDIHDYGGSRSIASVALSPNGEEITPIQIELNTRQQRIGFSDFVLPKGKETKEPKGDVLVTENEDSPMDHVMEMMTSERENFFENLPLILTVADQLGERLDISISGVMPDPEKKENKE